MATCEENVPPAAITATNPPHAEVEYTVEQVMEEAERAERWSKAGTSTGEDILAEYGVGSDTEIAKEDDVMTGKNSDTIVDKEVDIIVDVEGDTPKKCVEGETPVVVTEGETLVVDAEGETPVTGTEG